MFKIPFIAIAAGLYAHIINPRNTAGFQRNKDSVSEKTVFKSVRLVTGFSQASIHGLSLSYFRFVFRSLLWLIEILSFLFVVLEQPRLLLFFRTRMTLGTCPMPLSSSVQD